MDTLSVMMYRLAMNPKVHVLLGYVEHFDDVAQIFLSGVSF